MPYSTTASEVDSRRRVACLARPTCYRYVQLHRIGVNVVLLAHACCIVFPFATKDGSVQQHLGFIRITKEYSRGSWKRKIRADRPRWVPDGHGAKLLIHPCEARYMCGDYCRKCKPDRMIYLAHKDCWKVTFADFYQGKFLNWSRLAVQTRPFEARDWTDTPQVQAVVCHDDPGVPTLGSLGPNSSLFHTGTPLGGILLKVSLLPTEI